MNRNINFDPDKIGKLSLDEAAKRPPMSTLLDELRSSEVSKDRNVLDEGSFDDAFDIFEEEMLIPDSLTDEGIKLKEELKEQGLDGELTFYIPGFDASGFYEGVKITEKKINRSGETLYRVSNENGSSLLFTAEQIKVSVQAYAQSSEIVSKYKEKGFDITTGTFANPNTGEMTPDIRLVSMTRSEAGTIDFNFVFHGGAFTLDQTDFVSQVRRSGALKKYGLRLSEYVGLDKSSAERAFKVIGLSDERQAYVVMEDSNGVQEEFPSWYIRSMGRNQAILNSEVQGESASEVLNSLRDLGKKLDAANTFESLLQLSAEFESLVSYKVPPTTSGNIRVDFDLMLNNRINQFEAKLEELAPYKSAIEGLANLKQELEVTTDPSKLEEILQNFDQINSALREFESADFLKLAPLAKDFYRHLSTVSKLKERGLEKLNSINLYNGVNDALSRFNPGYESSLRKVNRFKDRFKFLNFEGIAAHEKIFAHVSLEVEAFRSEFLDPIYENHRRHSKAVASLHRKFTSLYDQTFGKLDSDPLCLRKNTKEFVSNWTEMMRYFEMFNFAEEADSLSALEVSEDNHIEIVAVYLDDTLEDLPEFSNSEDVYATFKRMESKKNAKIAQLTERNSNLLTKMLRDKLTSLASIFGFSQDELDHGMLDSFQTMVETNKIPAAFNESKGFEHRFEDLLGRIASMYPKLIMALKTDLAEFGEEYCRFVGQCNLAIVANTRIAAPVPQSSRGLIGAMRDAFSSVFK